jgi:hypothetical protein
MENVPAFTLALLGLGALGLYLLPTMLEVLGGRDRAWVVAVNVAAGWTGLGWLLALVAALTGRHGPHALPAGVRGADRPRAGRPRPRMPTSPPAATSASREVPQEVPPHPGALVDGRLSPPPRGRAPRTPVGHG